MQVVLVVLMSRLLQHIPGGGGSSPQILVGMCCGKVKNGGLQSELARENAGLWSELKRQSGGSPELTIGRVWLALWPTANPGVLPERFAFGLAAVSRQWAANGLNIIFFF